MSTCGLWVLHILQMHIRPTTKPLYGLTLRLAQNKQFPHPATLLFMIHLVIRSQAESSLHLLSVAKKTQKHESGSVLITSECGL